MEAIARVSPSATKDRRVAWILDKESAEMNRTDISVLVELQSVLSDHKRNLIFSLKNLSEDEAYTASHRVYREITRSTVDGYCTYLSDKICRALENVAPDEELNVCSVGCGDGEVDFKILSQVSERFPQRRVNFVGIDINKSSCIEAEKKLSSLPYSTTIINEGILEVDQRTLPKFDVVQMVHVHYYIIDHLECLFSKALDLVKPKCGSIEVIVTKSTPLWRLVEPFNNSTCFAHQLIKELEMIGLKFTTHDLPGVADFSCCVEEDFRSQYALYALDFFSLQNLSTYPPEVTDLCIKYIRSCLDDKGCCECAGMAITLPIE